MDEAFRLFENFYVMLKRLESLFRISDEVNNRMMRLYQSGYVFPLAERDEHGRIVLFIQLQKIDPDNFVASDANR